MGYIVPLVTKYPKSINAANRCHGSGTAQKATLLPGSGCEDLAAVCAVYRVSCAILATRTFLISEVEPFDSIHIYTHTHSLTHTHSHTLSHTQIIITQHENPLFHMDLDDLK